jgi:hypothetical protein
MVTMETKGIVLNTGRLRNVPIDGIRYMTNDFLELV